MAFNQKYSRLKDDSHVNDYTTSPWLSGNMRIFLRTLGCYYVVHRYKRKGDRSCCDNRRGISLLCIAGKTLAHVLLNKLNTYVTSKILPKIQCGFRFGRGTTDMIFTARQTQEKCREQNISTSTSSSSI